MIPPGSGRKSFGRIESHSSMQLWKRSLEYTHGRGAYRHSTRMLFLGDLDGGANVESLLGKRFIDMASCYALVTSGKDVA